MSPQETLTSGGSRQLLLLLLRRVVKAIPRFWSSTRRAKNGLCTLKKFFLHLFVQNYIIKRGKLVEISVIHTRPLKHEHA